MTVIDPGDSELTEHTSWVLMARDESWFVNKSFEGARLQRAQAPRHFRGWTDDYSNLFEVLVLR